MPTPLIDSCSDAELVDSAADGVRDRGWGAASQVVEEGRLRAISERIRQLDAEGRWNPRDEFEKAYQEKQAQGFDLE